MRLLLILSLILLIIPIVSASDPIETIKETFKLEESSCTSYASAITFKREVTGKEVNGENITEVVLKIINPQNVPLQDIKVNENLPDSLKDQVLNNDALFWEFDEIKPKEEKIVKYGIKKKISEEEILNFPEPSVSIEEPTPIKRVSGVRVSAAVVATLVLLFLGLLHLHIIKKTI